MSIATDSLPRKTAWALFIVSAAGISLYSAPPYLTLDPAWSKIPLNGAYVSHLLWVSVHGVPGAVALLIGPFQFIAGFRSRFPKWHRRMGRVYAVCIVIGSIAGFVSALMSTSGIPAQIGFVLLALAWLFTMWKGYQAARTRRFGDHRLWMIRNYALTFAAVLLRVFLGLGSIAMAIWPQVTFSDIYLASTWGSILVSAVLAEWLLVSPSSGRRN
ncbi:DUF2306 domain-containing protein [Pararhizobium sp. BT-229]|uniref:DUF2306 domain-containing protein n=1 Tax=Pararhizobium sp. BT-229 TaxID=2986923 RepID=UPI0021F76EF3|nr:DUF2306 domain-containing protein [Pararhizobium sp. BT-229]MCV9961923.1 DUF2306 domain-containing protein [Pararhizobium sp. BT-229]